MPVALHKHAMFLEEMKLYLNGTHQKEIATLKGVSLPTISGRITQTFYKLIDYFELHQRNIAFPHIKNLRGGLKFKNAVNYSDFWLKLINDYETGVKYEYNLPKQSKGSYSFEGIAASYKRSEVLVHQDGVSIHTDLLPLCPYRLQIGKKYRIIIQELEDDAPVEPKPNKIKKEAINDNEKN